MNKKDDTLDSCRLDLRGYKPHSIFVDENIMSAKEYAYKLKYNGMLHSSCIKGYKPPSASEVVGNISMPEYKTIYDEMAEFEKKRQKHIMNEIMNFSKIPKEYLRESENLMRSDEKKGCCTGGVSKRPDMWTMYDVIVVDKESLKIVKDERVVAKNIEHAKGKAGYYDVLADKCHDNTKLVVKVARITDVRPVEDAE